MEYFLHVSDCVVSDGRTGGPTHGRADARVGRRIDDWTDGRVDGKADGRAGGRTGRRADGWTGAETDERASGRTGWADEQADGRLDHSQFEKKRVRFWRNLTVCERSCWSPLLGCLGIENASKHCLAVYYDQFKRLRPAADQAFLGGPGGSPNLPAFLGGFAPRTPRPSVRRTWTCKT